MLLASRGHSVSFNTTVGGDMAWVERSSSNRTMAEQMRNQAPLFNQEHLLSKRLEGIVRTFE